MSSIKVCFIPPKGLESHIDHGDMVMSLAQLADVLTEPVYVRTIQVLSSRGKFVIIDNGASEGAKISYATLEARARYLGAKELVLPDVLGEADGTRYTTEDFISHSQLMLDNYMGVLQGTTVIELQKLVEYYCTHKCITTIGLPRLLLLQDRMPLSIRIDMANWISHEYPGRFNIHLLGASSRWAKEPYYASSVIRSIDTSLPYNYGLRGLAINNTAEVVDRPEGYFSMKHVMTGRILQNEEVYRSWCNNSDTP